MKLKLNRQLFLINDVITSDWISLSEFEILEGIDSFNIFDFFKSEYYKIDFLNFKIKSNKTHAFPKPLLKNGNVNISKFTIYNKFELYSFLENYTSNIDLWGIDFHNNFNDIFFKLKPHLSSINTCYLIDKDCFDYDSLEVTDSFLYYDYYILFVWVDILEKKFYTCEWASD